MEVATLIHNCSSIYISSFPESGYSKSKGRPWLSGYREDSQVKNDLVNILINSSISKVIAVATTTSNQYKTNKLLREVGFKRLPGVTMNLHKKMYLWQLDLIKFRNNYNKPKETDGRKNS